MFRRWRTTLLNYVRTPPGHTPSHVADDIRAEIESHLAHAIEDHQRRGESAHEARQAAVSEFGDLNQAIAGCHQVWRIDQLLCHWAHVALTTVLLIGVAGLLFAIRPWPTSSPITSADGDLEGRVLNESSQPIAQAHILAVVKTWPPNGYRQQAYMTTTDADGTFRIGDVYPTHERFEVQLAVVADRCLLESTYVNDGFGQLEPFSFTLRPSEPVVLRFRTPDGDPLAGVEVFPHRRVDTTGEDNLVYFNSAEPVVSTTDVHGIAQLPYFGPGDRGTVYFRLPGHEWTLRDFEMPREKEFPVLDLQVSAEGRRGPAQQSGN